MQRLTRFLMILTLAAASAPAHAQPPSPLDAELFPFPGTLEEPASAASAGVSMADVWLGESPYSNPAAPPSRGITLSPLFLRTDRQDLRAHNRNYDEKAGYFDGAGGAIGMAGLPGLEHVPLWIYAYQPVLRLESFAFNRGTGNDPSVQPAVVRGQVDSRETRAGIASSLRVARVRLGASVEWSRRDDAYDTSEQSGAPDQGDRHVDFSGQGVGGSAGFRFDSADSGAGTWTVGGALRWVPEIPLDGVQELNLLSGSSQTAVSVKRASGAQGGVAARYAVTEAFRALVSFGGASQQEWKSFGIKGGSAVAIRIGGEYRAPGEPLTLRFGLGQEQQRDVPEPRAGTIGLGVGYESEGMTLDVGLLHRGFERTSRPRSYDDRVVASVRVSF